MFLFHINVFLSLLKKKKKASDGVAKMIPRYISEGEQDYNLSFNVFL